MKRNQQLICKPTHICGLWYTFIIGLFAAIVILGIHWDKQESRNIGITKAYVKPQPASTNLTAYKNIASWKKRRF